MPIILQIYCDDCSSVYIHGIGICPPLRVSGAPRPLPPIPRRLKTVVAKLWPVWGGRPTLTTHTGCASGHGTHRRLSICADEESSQYFYGWPLVGHMGKLCPRNWFLVPVSGALVPQRTAAGGWRWVREGVALPIWGFDVTPSIFFASGPACSVQRLCVIVITEIG